MNKLIQVIELVRGKLDLLRKHDLKETPTRTIIIDPLLEALGWDIRDPNEVQLEYPTIDSKSVDYALKINGKAAVLVEAKPLGDPLNDVKGITQVVGYAANDGIVWCILSNGVLWKVYKSVENCAAPDKLMFEVSIDPRDSDGLAVPELAKQMWRFSRDEVAKGTLDTMGTQVFLDGKVRKAMEAILRDPPKQLLKLIRGYIGDKTLAPQKIRESLVRLESLQPAGLANSGDGKIKAKSSQAGGPPESKQKKGKSVCDEKTHIDGMSQEVIELYRTMDRICMSMSPSEVSKVYRKKYISYKKGKRAFCNLHTQRGGLRVWLQLKLSRVENPPAFARDVSSIGHWGTGDLELAITTQAQVEQAIPLIRKSFDEQR